MWDQPFAWPCKSPVHGAPLKVHALVLGVTHVWLRVEAGGRAALGLFSSLCCPRPQRRGVGRGRVCSGSRWHCRLRHGPAAALKLGSPGCRSAWLRIWGFQGFQLHFRSGVLSSRGKGPTAGTDPALAARQGRADVLAASLGKQRPGGPEICTEPCREPVRAGEEPSRAALSPSAWPSCSSLLLPEVSISTRLVWAPQQAVLTIFPAAPSRSSSAARRQ